MEQNWVTFLSCLGLHPPPRLQPAASTCKVHLQVTFCRDVSPPQFEDHSFIRTFTCLVYQLLSHPMIHTIPVCNIVKQQIYNLMGHSVTGVKGSYTFVTISLRLIKILAMDKNYSHSIHPSFYNHLFHWPLSLSKEAQGTKKYIYEIVGILVPYNVIYM